MACRHRFAYVCAAAVLSRCVLLLCTFLLLPPAAWPTHTWAGYVVSASSRPLANALALSVYDQLVKVGRAHWGSSVRSTSPGSAAVQKTLLIHTCIRCGASKAYMHTWSSFTTLQR